jgi:hypothetical protein
MRLIDIPRKRVLTVARTFELAQKAHSLYLTRNHAERGQLLKTVLLNCATDGVSLWPTYRKPFDLIFQRAKNEEWSGRVDLNHRPPGPEQQNQKIQMLRLVSLRSQKAILSLPRLYRSCPELSSLNVIGGARPVVRQDSVHLRFNRARIVVHRRTAISPAHDTYFGLLVGAFLRLFRSQTIFRI